MNDVPLILKKQIQTNPIQAELRKRMVEYACSAWAMGSAHDVAKALHDEREEYWFVQTWHKEIDWIAENMEDLILGGIDAV